jgi:hypothetical protein
MLAARPKTFLIDEPEEPFPEIPAEQDQILSQFIGQIHTEVELICVPTAKWRRHVM